MKFTRYILLFTFILCLCGCGNTATSSEPAIIINIPNDNSVNGYRITVSETSDGSIPQSATDKTTPSENNVSDICYCASVSSKKFHTSKCGSAKNIKEENLLTSPDRQYFIDNGYEPCGRCNP